MDIGRCHFEVLVRRQIARLLDPSLQCARFIHDELVKDHDNEMLCSELLGIDGTGLGLIMHHQRLGK